MSAIAPRDIRLETENYIVRTLAPGDATEAWGKWLMDPVAQRMLNTSPTTMSVADLRNYIARFDRRLSHILGIYEKTNGRLIGIRAVYIAPAQSEFLVNVLIGETDARNKGARGETRTVMYKYFFEDMDLKTARCTVLDSNAPVLKVMWDNGWIKERTEFKPAAAGQGTIPLHHFLLPRDVWRAKEKDKASGAGSQ